jgi:hypothetical protein
LDEFADGYPSVEELADDGDPAGDAQGRRFFDAADDGFELEERSALRRVPGLATELEDVSEVEYRQLRLERVVLIGVWTSGTAAAAETSSAGTSRTRRPTSAPARRSNSATSLRRAAPTP